MPFHEVKLMYRPARIGPRKMITNTMKKGEMKKYGASFRSLRCHQPLVWRFARVEGSDDVFSDSMRVTPKEDDRRPEPVPAGASHGPLGGPYPAAMMSRISFAAALSATSGWA